MNQHLQLILMVPHTPLYFQQSIVFFIIIIFGFAKQKQTIIFVLIGWYSRVVFRRRHPLAYSPWNLRVLPRLRGSLLRYVRQTLPGVTDPMVYVGQCFSTFCPHTEDSFLYSISYNHAGAPKVWYGVPQRGFDAFEKAMRTELPDLFAAVPNLMFQLVTLLPPHVLLRHNVPLTRAVHRQGEFIVTLPAAYHFGFNTGFNIAEVSVACFLKNNMF